MEEQRIVRIQRIQGNIFQLENLSPSYMLTPDVLSQFIDDLLRDVMAEATDLRKEKNFIGAAGILHRSLLVYDQHVYLLQLQNREDDVRVMELRILKATMSVFAGIFQWAIEEAKLVIQLNENPPGDTDRKQEARLILSVAEAGMDLKTYRDGKMGKIELMRQQKLLHHLNGREQDTMLNLMIQELEKELGPFVEVNVAEVNKSPTPDPEWIPDHVKKHREKLEANKAKKQEKKKKSFSRLSRDRTDSSVHESSDDRPNHKRHPGPQGEASKHSDSSSEVASDGRSAPPSGSGDNSGSKKIPAKTGKAAQHSATKKSVKVTPPPIDSTAQPAQKDYGFDSFERNQRHGHHTPQLRLRHKGQRQTKHQTSVLNQHYGLDTFDDPDKIPAPTQKQMMRMPSPQRPASPARNAPSPTPQRGPSRHLPPPPAFHALSLSSQGWLRSYQFKLACPRCFSKNPHHEGIHAFKFLPRLAHICTGNILICQLKSLGAQVWGRIRQRTNVQFMGHFRICLKFSESVMCRPGDPMGYNLCHFPHSREEMAIWEADRARNFNDKELVTFLRHQEMYRKAQQEASQPQAPVPEPLSSQLRPQTPASQPGEPFLQQHIPTPQHRTPSASIGHDVDIQPRASRHPPSKCSDRTGPSKPAPSTKESLLPPKGRAKQQAQAAATDEPRDEESLTSTSERNQSRATFTSARAQNISILIQTLRGNFVYCCGQCFHASPPRISIQHHKETSKCSNNERRHDWTIDNRLLVFSDYTGGFRKIRPRPPNKPDKVALCWNLRKRYGCLHGDSCGFAHSEEEVEFWLFERMFSFISRDDVVEVSERVYTPPERPPSPVTPQPKRRPPSPAPKRIPPFQHKLRILCGICYPKILVEQSPSNPDKCGSSNQHPWGAMVVYEIYRGIKKWDRVFPRNPRLKPAIHPILCEHGQRCDYRGVTNQPCKFPHYQEEKDLWVYQACNNLMKIEDVIAIRQGCEAAHPHNLPAEKGAGPARMPTEGRGVSGQFVCTYCETDFDEKWHLEQHLKTPEHIARMNSDREKSWQHRDPPLQITNGDYIMCHFNESGMCRYSGKPDDENLCDYAHKEGELTEWKERHKYRMMKMKKAREQKLFSFLDELIQAYIFTNKKEKVMLRELPGVEVTCIPGLKVSIPYKQQSEEGSCSKCWEFQVTVSEQRKLKRIGLLYDEHRQYFYLSQPSEEERPQTCPGSWLVTNANDRSRYSFEVHFGTDVLGCFYQWVVFDFGENPVLYVPLAINIGSEKFEPRINALAVESKKPWTVYNSTIVEYPSWVREDPFYLSLRKRYPPPISGEIKLNYGYRMTQRNYHDYYHKMLQLEEIACNERLKKFTGRSELLLFDTLEIDGVSKAQGGELYGKISMGDSLLDDSEASQIVVSNVRFALLKFDESSDVVYQAKILGERNLDLRRDDSIYVSLGEQCVREQGLEPNKKNLQVLVQFQLERVPFCEMHFGIDNITATGLIFPPADMIPRFPRDQNSHDGMNLRQCEVSEYIVKAGINLPYVPGPTMIIGPSGTGKTETIAKTIIRLLCWSSTYKILVCTHSDSAADWLITYYLHPFLEDRGRIDPTTKRKLLRVYDTTKYPASVPKVIRDNYAIFNEGRCSLRKPTFQDIKDCHIVVTTLSSSIQLVALQNMGKSIKGYFEYIFIDEAGQALETETIIPLGLAIRNTMVVMAGDHIQMRPKIFSEQARSQNFHISMLERLFLWDQQWRCKNVCFLTSNYRMVREILRFIARYHYGCELVARCDHYRHPKYYPMSFLTVKGEDQMIGTSYVNMAEVNAIVEKVQELDRNWPQQWEKNNTSIAVLTPYRLQVEQIRKKLREHHLDQVNVESVQNAQGKEYRAVFISTVRTRNTLNKAQITAISSSGQSSHEQYYYGFLSDEGELVTAFTRCQCLLFVVGDPIALCSVGECHGAWEKYIKECEDNHSIYPTRMTLECIKQEMLATKQTLNHQAFSYDPIERTNPASTTSAETTVEQSLPKAPPLVFAWGAGPTNMSGKSTNWNRNGPQKRLSSNEFPTLEDARVDEFGDYQEEGSIDDEILKELRIQVKKDEKVYHDFQDSRTTRQTKCQPTLWDAVEEASENSGEEDDNDSSVVEISGNEAKDKLSPDLIVKSDSEAFSDKGAITNKTNGDEVQEGPKQDLMKPNFRMVERDGGIFLVQDNRSHSNLEGARDFGTYNSDEEQEHLETELGGDGQTDHWLGLTLEYPDYYKECVVRFEPSGRVYALPVDGSTTEEITISSKRRRERALDGDRVVMHILSESEGDYEAIPSVDGTELPKKVYGEVKHILKRSSNPKFKKVVCTIDPDNYDLMSPIDRSFPKMFPMGRKKDKDIRAKGVPQLQLYRIQHYGNERFLKDEVVKVTNAEIHNALFVVLYYEWFAGNPYPMGIVTERLPPCDSPRNGMKILKLMYGVKDQWPPSFAKDIEDNFPDHWEIPKSEITSRDGGDFRRRQTFTVDPPESLDLDDAIHVERLEDNMLRVGVHIADVSYFIRKGSELDEEVRRRATTFYPTYFALASHMLPTNFSTSLCSLLPGKARLTVSVIFTFDRQGEEIGSPQIIRSVICSVGRLSYEQVEKFLVDRTQDFGIPEQVKGQVLDLQNLTSYLRKLRLGDARFFHQPAEGEQDVTCTMAHTLVEEMMIRANEAVAKYLVEQYGLNVPVRHQFPPDSTKAKEWLSNFEKEAKLSLKLSSHLQVIGEVVGDSESAAPPTGVGESHSEDDSIPESDISDFSLGNGEQVEESVPLTWASWNKLTNALHNNNMNMDHTYLDIVNIIGDEKGHPKQAVAISQLYRILDRASYTNARDQQAGCRHFSLQKDIYTHFTSPIRRYIDLVVHRMVVASLIGKESPYEPQELADICHHCNNQTFKANKYSKMVHCLLVALKLKMAGEPKLAFLEAANDRGLQLMYPHEHFLTATRSSTSVPLKHLKPAKKAMDGDQANSVILYFKNSVYDLGVKVPEVKELGAFLRTDWFVQCVPPGLWETILRCVKEERFDDLQSIVASTVRDMQNANGKAVNGDRQSARIEEITSEVGRNPSSDEETNRAPKKHVEFQQDYNPGQVIQVQLTAGMRRGLLVPKVQLVNITPKFNFCIEHRENPVLCFAKLAEKPPEKSKGIQSYVKAWLPVVEMMGVHNTVSGDETTYVRGLPVQWYKSLSDDKAVADKAVCGRFTLAGEWCDERKISHYDYLCIRIDEFPVHSSVQLKMKNLEQKPGVPASDLLNPHAGKRSVVLHAVTSLVSKDEKKKMTTVEFEVHQHPDSCDIPQELFDQTKEAIPCTVEIIPKSQPDRRMERALSTLCDTKGCKNLIRNICLRRPLDKMNNIEDSDVVSKHLRTHGKAYSIRENIRDVPFSPPNEFQEEAMKLALSNTFSVIQGPPGTGKTRTGAFLAYFFYTLNKHLPCNPRSSRPQLLYCGPSNKSVDVITNYLTEFATEFTDFKIVRVYSESIEQQVFPLPGENSAERKFGSGQEACMDPNLKNVSLHHKIRSEHSKYGSKITAFERRFKDQQVGMTKKLQKQVREHKALIKQAMTEELENHDVVLCTCNASGRLLLKDALNIIQVIIDEAGMCSEPETLIPLVSHNPSRVVLIGDHMQLRPIIQEPHARKLGAEKSLMEKYKDRAYTLKIQYRMHEEICHFPSKAFYGGELRTADEVRRRPADEVTQNIWPDEPDHPRVFCHVVGREETVTVRSEEGNEMSRSNQQEVYHVVRIVKFFIQRLRVLPEKLAVLSQYRLQCAEIEKGLKKAGMRNILVSTVIKSQGSEWDYVILSTVRSMPKIEIEEKPGKGWKMKHLGFTTDENQMNVALTRAKRGHIIVGNKFLLRVMETWKSLLQSYEETNSLLPARDFPMCKARNGRS